MSAVILVCAVAAMPLLWVVQASIDESLYRRELAAGAEATVATIESEMSL